MEFKKYTKIKILGDEENKDIFKDGEDEIVIQEKIDGGSFRFYITKEGQIIFGSRTQQLTSDEGEDTNVEKNFRRCVEFIRNKFIEVKDELPENVKHLIFYGEAIIKHTMNYDWENMPPFLGFDIYDIRTGKYLDLKIVKSIFNDLKLEIAPIIWEGKVKELNKFLEKCKNEK